MDDWAESAALVAFVVAALWGLSKVAERMEARKTPERRKAEEREEWRHS